jgi:hypothetical protein
VTHLDLPEAWRFRGTDLSTYAVLVRRADGVDEFPEVRGDNIVVPSTPGRRWARKRHDQKRVALALWVNSLTAAGAGPGGGTTNATLARQNLDALYALFATNTPGALVRVMPDGTERTAQAEVVAVGNIEDEAGHEAVGVVVDFELADPYFYGAALAPSQATPTTPTNFNVTHPGTVATHRQVLTFTGPISNPRLLNLTIDPTGSYFVEALVTVAPATTLVIDCARFTALNNGVNAIGSLRHSGGFEFFRLEPGVNSLRVTATAAGGSLAIAYSPPYI